MASACKRSAPTPAVRITLPFGFWCSLLACLSSDHAKLTSDSSPPPQLSSSGFLAPLDKEDIRNAALARRAPAGDFDDELILGQLARNRVFLGPDGLDKLRNAFVIVVGCGGRLPLCRSLGPEWRQSDRDWWTSTRSHSPV